MKTGNLLSAAILAAATATGCSNTENCTLPTSDRQDISLAYTVLSEAKCIDSITDACKNKASVVCAVSPDDYTSDVERVDLDCSDTGGIEDTCGDNDVLMCNATNHPEASSLICDGEEK